MLLDEVPANTIHDGGRIRFGPDRLLYISTGDVSTPSVETPVAFFNPAIAPSGSSFYRGRVVPQFENNLFVGTLRGQHLLRLQLDGSGSRIVAQERLLDQRYGRIRDVVMGPDGLLYFCTNNRDGRGTPETADDRIARLAPA